MSNMASDLAGLNINLLMTTGVHRK